MEWEQRQHFSVTVGGFVLLIAAFFGVPELLRVHDGWLTAVLVALILWREIEFTGMRMDLNRFRATSPKDFSPLASVRYLQ
jgi:hypothetical protein